VIVVLLLIGTFLLVWSMTGICASCPSRSTATTPTGPGADEKKRRRRSGSHDEDPKREPGG